MGALIEIEHIVVLMLENRSFDSMLGLLYPDRDDFDGLKGTESNLDDDGRPVPIWSSGATDKPALSIPDPDPGELWHDINMQLFGTETVPNPPIPSMSGFVRNYRAQTAQPPSAYAGRNVMHAYTPDQVPVLSRLARAFAVCDRWHASAPCQTWPNRFFLHTGTANGYENNSPTHFPYDMPTIFGRLQQAGLPDPWKIYFHDVPQSLTLAELWHQLDRFRLYEEFRRDAAAGTLPAYSFIEPRYFADTALPNDQHPPHVVTYGEQLIADVYNCLRGNSAKWLKTLLIVTYDEHGGSFDHVRPPAAVPPGPATTRPFNFDRYGVRVPAVIVSPWVAPGTVLRPPGSIPFDHTSIIATLRRRFGLKDPMTARDASAPDLDCALTLTPSDTLNLGPESVAALPHVPNPTETAQARVLPLNGQQSALLTLAAHMPDTAASGDFHAFVDSWLAHLRQGVAEAALLPVHDIGLAAAFIQSKLGKLFRSL